MLIIIIIISALSDPNQIVTPTTPSPTAHNLTHGPTPSITAPPTEQPAIGDSTNVTAKTPAQGDPIAPPTPAPPLPPVDTNHTGAPPTGPTTVPSAVRPTTLSTPSTAAGPSAATLADENKPDHDVSSTHPSTTTEISTTPFVSIPPGVCVCVFGILQLRYC